MYSWVKLNHLVSWSEGRQEGPPTDPPISTVSTDTRTLKGGELFIALRGENFDGHDYIAEAVKRGAAAVLAEKTVAVPVPVIVVPDSLRALAQIARHLRDRFQGKTLAITGSAGKSSTKEMLGTLTGPGTVRSPASYNNLLGVSKTLCLIDDSTRYLVLEMGMNAFGEIKEMCELFRPQIVGITNIGDAHIGRLGGKKGIQKAKKEIFDYLDRAGAHVHSQTLGVALNTDDVLVVEAYREAFRQKVRTISYSALGAPADVSVREKAIDPESGFLFLKVAFGKRVFEQRFPLFGLHHAQNLIAATALASLAGIQLEEFRTRFEAIRPALHRGEIFQCAEDRILIDESYNSNPTALGSSLASLSQLNPSRRRVMVLGEMRELDEFADGLHREVGERLAQLFADLPFVLVGVGALTQHLLDAVKSKLPQADCRFVPDTAQARDLVKGLLKPRDLLFIKGSRGVQLDRLAADYRPG